MPRRELPLSTPSWLTVERIAVTAIALAGAAAAVPSVGALGISIAVAFACGGGGYLGIDTFQHADFGRVVAAPLLLSTLVLCVAFARRRVERPAGSAVLAGAVHGALNAPVAVLLMTLSAMLTEPHFEADGLLSRVLVLGALCAVPGAILGMVYALAFEVPLRAVARARATPAHDAVDRALTRCGGFLVAVGAPCFLLPFGDVARGVAVAALAIGGIALAVGAHRLALRRRFLAQVAAGELRGWSVVPCPEGVGAELLPFVRVPWCDGLLVRRIDGDAYRAPQDEAMALAPL